MSLGPACCQRFANLLLCECTTLELLNRLLEPHELLPLFWTLKEQLVLFCGMFIIGYAGRLHPRLYFLLKMTAQYRVINRLEVD